MGIPLAETIRPKELSDIVGQVHLLGEGKALRRVIDSGHIPNLVFYGPAGVGKTTLATMIAEKTNRKLIQLNGTTATTADLKEIISDLNTFDTMNGVLLYLDEIQYFNKKQQQILLEFIENGQITLIASTTENPYFTIYSAILSRSTVFEFKLIPPSEIEKAVKRGFATLEKERNVVFYIADGVISHISKSCGGDVRKAINAVELCVFATEKKKDGWHISLDIAEELTQKSAMRYDTEGDEHYDLLSAFQKSMRGSDANAAVYYLARLLEAGDLTSVCRRLLVTASEDVGLAYPNILPITKASVDIALQVGLPEARIPLADAVILVCTAPKSNTGYLAINRAMVDVKNGAGGSIPRHLQNKHFDGDEVAHKGQHYLYPHHFAHGYVKQQYLPDELKEKVYYEFGDNKNEQAFANYWSIIQKEEKK